ncbi:MAG: hypothetical protein R3F30_03570 [Planctomycetota bacterium]
MALGPLAAQDPGRPGPEPAAPGEAEAAPAAAAMIRMPVRLVADKLVARCELSTRFRRIPANLMISLDRSCGLELHNKAAFHLRCEDGAGSPITIHFPGEPIVVPTREHGDEEEMDELTRLYSKDLGEVALIGTIGSAILERYHLVLDVHEGLCELSPPRERSAEPPEPVEGETLCKLSTRNHQVWLPVRTPWGAALWMNLGTGRYETIVDQDLCEERDRLDGQLGEVRLGDVDLSRWVAFRPAELVQVHGDGALGTLGLDFLRCFRVELDRENGFASLRAKREPDRMTEAPAFYLAFAERDWDAMEALLTEHASSRLAREASERLLAGLVDSGAGPERLTKALGFRDATRIPDLRATEALATMKVLLRARRPDLAIEAGKLGLVHGREDRYPESVHRLHAEIGELCLDHGAADEAWEHLLSAAFGLPEDGRINLLLGRFYEREKRWRRALSRYVQAVITPEVGAEAVEGLERVQAAMGGEPFSVDLVDKLVAGKVQGFGAATRYEPEPPFETGRTVLAELFTNVHLARKQGESWVSFLLGGSLAAEGLLSHFPRDRMVLLTWHLPDPEPSSTVTEYGVTLARRAGHPGPGWFRIDGRELTPGAGRDRDAEAIYERARSAVRAALRRRPEHALEVEAVLADGRIRGTATVKGPPVPGARLELVLAERGVLHPGKGLAVVHRMVGRGSLAGGIEGVAFTPVDGRFEHRFDRSLAQVEREHAAYLADLEEQCGKPAGRLSMHFDPAQLVIVAILRHDDGSDVLQATQVQPVIEAPAEGGGR